MTSSNSAGAPIVVGVDGSANALDAVRWGAAEARNRHCPLRLVHAIGFPDQYVGTVVPAPPAFGSLLHERAWRSVKEAKRTATAVAPGTTVETEVVLDAAIPYLTELSRTARMIVLGSRGHGEFAQLLLGSTTVALAAHGHSPVVCVRGTTMASTVDDLPVVVGVDGSPLSERAIGYAFEAADSRGVPLVAVHAWGDADTESVFAAARMHFEWEPLAEPERRLLAQRLAGWQEKFPDVPVRRVLVRDAPRRELLTWSRKAQLVVVGSRGRGGFGGLLLGSASQALLHHGDCPVMVVRPEETC